MLIYSKKADITNFLVKLIDNMLVFVELLLWSSIKSYFHPIHNLELIFVKLLK